MKYLKLGCNWGAGAPDFYDMLKRHSIVVCADKPWGIGDIVAVSKGFKIVAIAKITGKRQPCTDIAALKDDFDKYKIDYEDWNNVADAVIYELPEADGIWYEQQKGMCSINQPDIKNKISITLNKIMSNMLIEECKKYCWETITLYLRERRVLVKLIWQRKLPRLWMPV